MKKVLAGWSKICPGCNAKSAATPWPVKKA
jgi:hypothetical protein